MIKDHNKNLVEEILGSKARVKILKILALKGELNISQIISITKLNHSLVLKHLLHLMNLNLIQEKIFGRIRIYRFKNENLKARSFKKFLLIWEDDL